MSENSTRIKLMKLLELLRMETDEEHPLSRSELCSRLNAQGIPCHVKTITRDIAALNEFGYEVCGFMEGREKYYYIPDRDFSVPELKIMIDAIQASSFVTEKKTADMIDKIAALGGSYRKQLLKRSFAKFNSRKHSNEYIFYNIESIETAILTGKKIFFHYYDLDVNKQKVLRAGEDGAPKRYFVEPVALILSEDNYYLRSIIRNETVKTFTFRVDRMQLVEVVDDSQISDEALAERQKVASYTEQAFRMHSGTPAKVKLVFKKGLIGPVVDKFGEGIKMKAVDDETCTATVSVLVGKTFFGWLVQFGTNIQIAAPDRVREEYREYLSDIIENTEI